MKLACTKMLVPTEKTKNNLTVVTRCRNQAV